MSSLLGFTKYTALTNWSVSHLLENQFQYNENYRLEKIGRFLKRNKTQVLVDDNTEYKRVKIKLYNKGVFLRNKEFGINIGTKKQFLIKKGQFLLSKIDARNGAFGLATDAVDGAIITADFFSYDIDATKIEPYFLVLMTTTEKFQKFAQSASSGTTGRQRIDEKKFLDVKIPLPSLNMQKEIVNKYKAKINLSVSQEEIIAQRENEIEDYLHETLGIEIPEKKETKNILEFVAFKDINEWSLKAIINTNFQSSKLFDTVELSKIILDKPKYGSNSKGIKEITNTRYIRITDINEDGTLNDNIVSAEEVKEQYILKQDDFLIARSGSVGRTFLYDEKYGRCLYAGYLIKFVLNKDLVDPFYLLYYTKSKLYRDWVDSKKRITGVPNINSQEYLKSPIILPDIKIQNKITNHLKELKKEIQDLKDKSFLNRNLALINFEKEIFL